jgi:acyl-CoA synthetase (AMP-forming)/AMP-acid ligase II
MTGDLGRIDDRGFLYILDRKKDMIVSGGMNIYAREVEDALITHPAVSECAVIAIPHPVFGESVCAVVVTDPEVPGEELTSHVVEQIAEFKKPQRYVFVAELPKNPTGKVQKAELRERYATAQ